MMNMHNQDILVIFFQIFSLCVCQDPVHQAKHEAAGEAQPVINNAMGHQGETIQHKPLQGKQEVVQHGNVVSYNKVASHVENMQSNVHLERGHPHLRNTFGIISQSEECAEDVSRVCRKSKFNPNNNFEILFCLSNNVDNDEISDKCHQYIWSYKFNATNNPKFHKILRDLCNQPLALMEECRNYQDGDGKLVSCLLEHRDSINVASCSHFLTKMETIVFSDYRFICEFVDDCKDDIIKHSCGKIGDVPEDHSQHSQGAVVHCLEEKMASGVQLQAKCLKQINRLAELSADDFHLDRYLYFKCKADRETLCPEVVAGEGRVYKCLFDHKFDNKMSHECREALTTRQKLVVADYKASYGLIHKCQKEIALHHCDKDVAGKRDVASLSKIMLCLENQSIDGVPISEGCDDELIDFRRMLMEDYELSPELTHSCQEAILKKCGGGLQKEGKTVHCLMEQAQEENGLNPDCQAALMDLIKETEVVQDYRIDAVLMHNCQSFISSQCGNFPEGDPMVLSCLMDHVHDKTMKKKCRDSMLELQYFVSRDFNIDPTFREVCHKDAQRFCSVSSIPGPLGAGNGIEGETENNDIAPIPLSLVLSCLYRHLHASLDEAGLQKQVGDGLTSACEEEVHRVIKQRALDVDLNPELERSCRGDLGKFCSEQSHGELGSEFVCLQDHYEQISEKCKSQIEELTQLEGQNTQDFENILIRECEPMLQKYCSEFLDKNDEGRVMECLIANKEIMESRGCAAGVTHFQLIEMKDYHFNYKFLKACKRDVDQLCAKGGVNKAEIVKCLSLQVRNAILEKKPVPVSSECQQQLTVEKLAMHKNIDLNPELKSDCSSDYLRYCKDVKSGKALVIQCLRQHKDQLSKKCYKALFKFEKEESENTKLDFVLMRSCKSDIKEHCQADLANGKMNAIIECLLSKKHLLQKSCRHVLVDREKEMFSDLELNPDLSESCHRDINALCKEAKKAAEAAHEVGKDPHGIIYSCLKEHFIDAKHKASALSLSCYRHVEFVMKEQEQNYVLDPQLTIHCINSIKSLCPPKEGFNVVECLKVKYYENRLTSDQQCMVEVARLLAEGHSDIMADPVLHQACALDISQHCRHVPEGHSRVITCLMNIKKLNGVVLTVECHDQLEQRKAMWEKAVKQRADSFSDIGVIIMQSEHSGYLLSLLSVFIVMLLVVGSLCGRLSKRVAKDRKTR